MSLENTHPLDSAKIGDGVTHTIWTDQCAGTIIARTPKSITMQRDRAVLENAANSGEADALQFSPGGFCGHTSGTQRYRYERDPQGRTEKFTRRTRKDGSVVWKSVGQKTRSPGGILDEGRNEHYDYNF